MAKIKKKLKKKNPVQVEAGRRAATARWARRKPGPGMVGEKWQEIPSFPGYWASTLGRIKSNYTIITPMERKGYLYVSVALGGVQSKQAVHRLVCEAFWGAAPDHRHIVALLDEDTKNTKPANLAWMTRAQLAEHRRGRGARGDIRLSTAEVEALKKAIADKEDPKKIAADFGVNLSYVYNIRAGRRLTAA